MGAVTGLVSGLGAAAGATASVTTVGAWRLIDSILGLVAVLRSRPLVEISPERLTGFLMIMGLRSSLGDEPDL